MNCVIFENWKDGDGTQNNKNKIDPSQKRKGKVPRCTFTRHEHEHWTLESIIIIAWASVRPSEKPNETKARHTKERVKGKKSGIRNEKKKERKEIRWFNQWKLMQMK